MPNAIEVSDISRRFGQLTAVAGVSFTVPEREIFGLLGPNGAGKSTLIRMLTTLIEPSGGSARVAGHDVAHEPNAVRLRIGVIPQNMTSDPDLTCGETLSIQARLYGVPAARRKQLAVELLERVQLADRRDALVKTLSGGMRRRLEIVRGLVHQPEILFLDEPTTGLDPFSRMSVWETVAELRDKHGLTIFLTTHYMDEADRLCDRIAIVDKGRIVALDSPAALKAAVPGASRIEVSFTPDLASGAAALERLEMVQRVEAPGKALYRVSTDQGPATAEAIMDLARREGVEIRSLAVQSTSLDDVFLHFTGHGLADEAAAPLPKAVRR